MSLFGKIKSIVRPKKEEKKPKKPAKKEEVKKEIPKAEPIKAVSRKKDLKDVHRILKEPHISEKATFLSDENKYIFKVYLKTNKIQIKNAVENLYGVKVRSVNVINIKSKSRKLRNVSGHKPGYKKAIVVLEKGYKIEILPH